MQCAQYRFGHQLRDIRRWSVLVLTVFLLPGCVMFRPGSMEEMDFVERVEREEEGGVKVEVAALGRKEAKKLFDVPLANKGIQAVWVTIDNQSEHPYLFFQTSMDSQYFSSLEAAYKSHYSPMKRFLSLGLVGFLFPPLWLAIPPQIISAPIANHKMNKYFVDKALGSPVMMPGETKSGFVFTHVDEGTKQVNMTLLGPGPDRRFTLFVTVPGVNVDHVHADFETLWDDVEIVSMDMAELRDAVRALPCCVTNKRGHKTGDPLNVAIVGSFESVLQAMTRAGWDETEPISWGSNWRTAKAFVMGTEYRYSPVSSLYLYGRKQDFAMQKARDTIDERNHMRLWLAPFEHEGQPVWVGQVSRDIGVRFTTKAWNLTTHKIDPNVDDARENVVGDLIEVERADKVGYVRSVLRVDKENPGRNLTGDPYTTDGYRSISFLAERPVDVDVLSWFEYNAQALKELEAALEADED
jgi:hypothetical protein